MDSIVSPPGSIEDKHFWANRLHIHLAEASAVHAIGRGNPDDLRQRLHLREWQSRRLADTHADLLAHARYGPAAAFFLDDLYGPKDFSERDAEVQRILPMLVKLLPASAVRALALAVELDALSERLDGQVLYHLRAAGAIDDITTTDYACAYVQGDTRSARQHQIELVGEVGEALGRLTRHSLVSAVLHMMHKPAHLAGLGELHEFLQRGFDAFRHMGTPDEFLALIRERETALMEALFAGCATPS
ncbi:MAG: hypothetical protein HY778_18415 [Betaproteobacteria bacterium]|nr:hypothetical protein [Betaproteobacteria bacterium]